MPTIVFKHLYHTLLPLLIGGLVAYYAAPGFSQYLGEDIALWQIMAGILTGVGAVLASLFSQWRIVSAIALVSGAYAIFHVGPEWASSEWHTLSMLFPLLALIGVGLSTERGPLATAPLLALVALAAAAGLNLRAPAFDPSWMLNGTLFEQWEITFTPILTALVLAIGTLMAAQLWRPEGSRGAALASLLCLSPLPLAWATPASALLMAAGAVLVLWAALFRHAWRLAFMDELTDTLNRRAMDLRLNRKVAAITMVDVDHFKRFNDKWGHDAGDQVLRRVARLLNACGPGAQVYRYGGEEFAIIHRTSHPDRAKNLLEQLRKTLAQEPFHIRGPNRNPKQRGKDGGKPVRITASFGLAMARPGEATSETLRRADSALYRAKRNGRNRVVCSP